MVIAVNLIKTIIATSFYFVLSPFLLIYLLIRGEQPAHEYPRRKEETRAEPPFPLESLERSKLFRECVGKSVATVPVRRVQSSVRSGKLVSPTRKTKDSSLSGQLWPIKREERTDAGLRRVRTNSIRDRKTEREGEFS